MAETGFLAAVVDKFVFRISPDCRYSSADVWARREGNIVRVGLTDFLQQKSGDLAFVDVKPVGTVLAADDELAAVETIKVDLVVPAPLAGKIVSLNPTLADQPELVNTDPYGDGWVAEIEPARTEDFEALLDADAYLPQMKARAELEQQR
jgi:glycine cleavage system H protein